MDPPGDPSRDRTPLRGSRTLLKGSERPLTNMGVKDEDPQGPDPDPHRTIKRGPNFDQKVVKN